MGILLLQRFAMRVSVFLGVLCAAVLCANVWACGGGNCKGDDWDFALAVLRWPGTVTRHPLNESIDSFTYHGLWVTLNDTDYPCDCTNQNFNETKIESLVPELNTIWPDLQFFDNPSFWKHEWEKHGTSTENVLPTEFDFFNEAIKLHKQWDLINVLDQSDIYPSYDRYYPLDDITGAIEQAIGVKPLIKCQKHDGQYHLYRMGICVSEDSLSPIWCPHEMATSWTTCHTCGDAQEIYIPPIER